MLNGHFKAGGPRYEYLPFELSAGARVGRSPGAEGEAASARAAAGLMAVKSSDMGAPSHGLNGCSIARPTMVWPLMRV